MFVIGDKVKFSLAYRQYVCVSYRNTQDDWYRDHLNYSSEIGVILYIFRNGNDQIYMFDVKWPDGKQFSYYPGDIIISK